MSKKAPPDASAEECSRKPLPFREGRAAEAANAHSFSFSRIFGALKGLKGTVTIMPGVDLARPTGETWDAER
ncbi:MAG: hypothetical protein OXG03_06145 [Gammaproteobacteria bacterium]|nr:hypothetical protein [Gammaproteobacteria bacterium]